MNKIKVCFDSQSFLSKPTDEHDAPRISKRIGRLTKQLTPANIRAFALDVSLDGHTFCPATFKNGNRNKESFEQQQLFVLDFDNDKPDKIVSFDAVKKRADRYELPILFAYDTFRSKNHDRFRVAFLSDVSIDNPRVAKAMLLALGNIFPEADSNCYNDISKMYFGGKEVLQAPDEDDQIQTINPESLFRNMTNYFEDEYDNNFRRYIEKFSRETGIALNEKRLLDVSVVDDISELPAAKTAAVETGAYPSDKNSPTPIITKIIGSGDNLSKYYIINFGNRTGYTANQRKPGGHAEHRAPFLNKIREHCQLFREFEDGTRRPEHDELYGLQTNLAQVETGAKLFEDTLRKHSYYDNRPEKYRKWHQDLKYIRGPSPCDNFCIHKAQCGHAKNILLTADKTHIRLPDYNPRYVTIEEAQADLDRYLTEAINADDNGVHVIKAQTALGKTETFLNHMKNPHKTWLIAASTNKLKHELFNRAANKGIDTIESPSLSELELPDDVQGDIDRLYATGRHRLVNPYLKSVIKEDDIRCSGELREYLDELEDFNNSDINAIVTHKKFSYMDEKKLQKYDVILIDEDYILKTIAPDQCAIPIKSLKKALDKIGSNSEVAKKIKDALKAAKTERFFRLSRIDYDDKGMSKRIDIPSFCKAEAFYVRKASDEKNLLEDDSSADSIVFLRLPEPKNDVKLIIV